MRTHNLFSRLGLAMVAILLLSSMQQVYAKGTLAGTVITNQASVQYNAGSNVRSASSNVSSMTVGYKVSLNLIAPSSTTTTVDSTIIYKAFYASNNGNYRDNLSFTIGHVPAGWVATLYKDKNGNGIWAGNDTVITSGGSLYTDTTIANRIPVIVKIAIPLGAQAPDNMIDSVTIYVQSTGGLDGVVPVGGTGRQVYFANVTIAKPVLSFSVTPTYGANKIPGETENYALAVTNAGHAATNGNSTVTWLYDNTDLTSVTPTGGSARSASSGTATWTIGSVAGGNTTVTVNLSAVIEQISHNGTGVIYNTLITNGSGGSQVAYNDGLHNYSVNVSASTAFNVGRASGALLVRSTVNTTGNPGDNVDYTITVENTGNSVSDTYTLTDVQNGGNLNVAPVYSTTVGGGAVSQPVTINQGVVTTYYVRFVVPVTATDAQTIIRNVTATALSGTIAPTGGAYASMNTITTTVTAPNLTIAMSDSAVAGNVGTTAAPAPGDVLYYIVLITNNGTGTATSVSSSNLTPHLTTNLYNANSVQVDPLFGGTYTPVNDGAAFTGGSVGANTGGTVQVTFNAIPHLATAAYRYKVTIQ